MVAFGMGSGFGGRAGGAVRRVVSGTWRRMVACAVAAAFAASMVPGAAVAQYSAAVPASGTTVAMSYLKGHGGNYRSYRATAKVSGVASSRPGVVAVAPHEDGHGFDLTVRRAGSAKVTYSVGGARRAIAFKIRKYANPVKSFKLGARELSGRFARAKTVTIAKRRDLGRVRVVAAKGWRLKRVYSGFSAKGSVALKNGGSAGGALNVRAVLVNAATGVKETVEVRNG